LPPPVTNLMNNNLARAVIDFVDNPIISDTKTIKPLGTLKLGRLRRKGIGR